MLPFVPAGGVTCCHRPVRMKRILCIKKTMIVITIAFVSGIPAAYMPESLNAETSHAYHAQVSFISVVCRSSDSSIQAARLIAAYDLAPYCQHIASAFSPGHDSPSNDRFSPHAGIPPHGKQYFRITATFGILPRACNLKCTDCNPAMDSFRVRDSHPIPLFSWNKNACPFGTAGAVCTASASVRVAHLPQKPVIDSFFIFVFAFPAKRQKRLPFLRQSASITYILFYTWLFPRI